MIGGRLRTGIFGGHTPDINACLMILVPTRKLRILHINLDLIIHLRIDISGQSARNNPNNSERKRRERRNPDFVSSCASRHKFAYGLLDSLDICLRGRRSHSRDHFRAKFLFEAR